MSKNEHRNSAFDVMDMYDTSKPPTLLTVREVAEVLRVHQRTAYRLITGGSIKAIKIGSQWRVPESALMDFINQRWQESASSGKKKPDSQQYKLPLD
ncbi:Helix-turn-helix domain protein [Pseudodesulfovibrio profundus]|uniref:Helix-turn-helix domain protein n=1 Tax=Pseudodesulfovibrio profundus TaxID=57320 RepID=A0A2C8FAE6_9BACT|nr:helix-turn-helix domain-containing protein [Pseudodesulfovibrio profundus]SOB58855.1 Helix-turn-helix domain protein [Pseudodesulfovibrio profundus]